MQVVQLHTCAKGSVSDPRSTKQAEQQQTPSSPENLGGLSCAPQREQPPIVPLGLRSIRLRSGTICKLAPELHTEQEVAVGGQQVPHVKHRCGLHGRRGLLVLSCE